MTPRTVPIDSLTHDPRNARRHNARNLDAIRASLSAFGQVRPIVVDRAGVVLAGNGTLEAARALGWTSIAVVEFEGTAEAAQAFAVADNRTAELAEWDREVLAEILADLDAPAAVGFDDADLAALIEGLDAGPASKGKGVHSASRADRLARSEAALNGKLAACAVEVGDLWALGDHRLACADSLDGGIALALDGRATVDAVITDPPYAIFGSSTGLAASIADDRMVVPFFENLIRECARVLPVFGHLLTFCDWRSLPATMEGARRNAIAVKNVIVWDKGNGLGSMYAHTYELVAFMVKEPRDHTMRGAEITGHRQVFAPNLIRHNRASAAEKAEHNAAKPVDLVIGFVERHTDPCARVLDPFLGGGSTLIACERTGRVCFGVEVDARRCEGVIARWERETGGKAERVRSAG
jgi:DNA modification methylase